VWEGRTLNFKELVSLLSALLPRTEYAPCEWEVGRAQRWTAF
jgi:hypothetical protein